MIASCEKMVENPSKNYDNYAGTGVCFTHEKRSKVRFKSWKYIKIKIIILNHRTIAYYDTQTQL